MLADKFIRKVASDFLVALATSLCAVMVGTVLLGLLILAAYFMGSQGPELSFSGWDALAAAGFIAASLWIVLFVSQY